MTSVESFNSDIRTPAPQDNIYKDECCFSFDFPESKDGLFVCLHTFLGFGKEFVKLYHSVTGLKLFLNIKRIKKPIEPTDDDSMQSPTGKKPKRLAIGLEGGFTPDKECFVCEDVHTIVILPDFNEMSLEDATQIFPSLEESVQTILSRESASKADTIAWDGEVRAVSQYALNLEQHNGVKIPPTGLKCADCDLTTNLWLNLTDGTVLCGRRYFDGTGGNNHGLEHFQKTRYPLAVKLGTITPSGADVHSYKEDTMVEDPKLSEHLCHFGINMMQMEKTEQTMTEMEIELNEKVGNEWDIIQESGKKLKILSGPGLTGIQNMGNTCYMNSSLQVLYSMAEFEERYSSRDRCWRLFQKHLENLSIPKVRSNPARSKLPADLRHRIQDMVGDFTLQMCKVGYALEEHQESTGQIPRPRALKRIIGRGHSEFSSNRQQDAHEFILHLFSLMEQNQHASGVTNPSDAMKFIVEDRLECQQSGKVKYSTRPEYALSLEVNPEDAINPDALREYEKLKEANKRDVSVQLGQVVRAQIPFTNCLNRWLSDELIQGFWSTATKVKGVAKKRYRFSSFPEYLVIHLKKFTADENWIPRKLDVSMMMPEEMDLSEFRGTGIQKNETVLPEGDPPKSEPEVQIKEEDVVLMGQMGFNSDECRQALIATQNSGIESAMNWLFEKRSTGFAPGISSGVTETQGYEADEESVTQLMAMGFTRPQSVKALSETSGSLERSVDWLFSHPDDPGMTSTSDDDNVQGGDASNTEITPTAPTDGCGKYEMFAFISHMGTSTMCGHYVCHIKKSNRWVIYNDEKVAESVDPPKDLGYIYFYKRVAA